MNEFQKLKTFFEIQSKGKTNNEYINLATTFIDSNGEKQFHYISFSTVEEALAVANVHKNSDLFFGIALTDGQGAEIENVVSSNIIGLDFDYAEGNKPNATDFTDFFRNKLKIFISALVDSGHGYHVYIAIEKTYDLEYWHKTSQRLQRYFKADGQAIRINQLLRFPTSYNYKGQERKKCKLIYVNEGVPYSLNKINLIIDQYEKQEGDNAYLVVRSCIENMLNGVKEGYRNFALSCIVPEFKRLNRSYEECRDAVLSFNMKCLPPENESKVLNSFKKLWDSNIYTFPGCYFKDSTKNDFVKQFCAGKCYAFEERQYIEKSTKIEIPKCFIEPKILKSLNGAEVSLLLFIYANKEIDIKSLKTLFSYNTLTSYVNHLVDLNFIEFAGTNSVKIRKHITNKISIDSRVFELCLRKKITKNEAKVYYCIAFLNSIKERTTITHIAEMLNMGKGNVSEIIQKLKEGGLISIFKKCNGAGYIYKVYS